MRCKARTADIKAAKTPPQIKWLSGLVFHFVRIVHHDAFDSLVPGFGRANPMFPSFVSWCLHFCQFAGCYWMLFASLACRFKSQHRSFARRSCAQFASEFSPRRRMFVFCETAPTGFRVWHRTEGLTRNPICSQCHINSSAAQATKRQNRRVKLFPLSIFPRQCVHTARFLR